MPKFFCDYCDVYLTHDSMSVRKAHNAGRNHLRNVQQYYEQISSEQTQLVINSITDAYNSEGQANPLNQAIHPAMGGFGPPGPGFPPVGFPPPGMPGLPPPPFMQAGRGGPPNLPPNLPFPPPNLPGAPPGAAGGLPPNLPFPPPNMPPGGLPFPPPFAGAPGPAGAPPGGLPFPPPGPGGLPQGPPGRNFPFPPNGGPPGR